MGVKKVQALAARDKAAGSEQAVVDKRERLQAQGLLTEEDRAKLAIHSPPSDRASSGSPSGGGGSGGGGGGSNSSSPKPTRAAELMELRTCPVWPQTLLIVLT